MKVTSKMRKLFLLRFKFLAVSALLLSMAAPVSSSESILWGSSSSEEVGPINPGSVFTIDEITGQATLVGSTGIPGGRNPDQPPEVSGIDSDPVTGTLYGISGSNCTGAVLITIDQTTGAGTVVGIIEGSDGFGGRVFDGTPAPYCTTQGSDGLAFHPDGRLFAFGYFGTSASVGLPRHFLLEIDKNNGDVLSAVQTLAGPGGITGLTFDASGVLWASHGSFNQNGISTVALATGNQEFLQFTDAAGASIRAKVSDLAFGPDGTLFASIPNENQLATVDTTTGLLTRIGSFGSDVRRMSGLAFAPPLVKEVEIDIKPGSFPNSINLGSGGATPVAILGSVSLNVNEIDTITLSLGTSGVKTVGKKVKQLCSVVDVSGDFSFGLEGAPDGYDDLVCHFVTISIVPEAGNTTAKLSGNFLAVFGGGAIEGTDSVNIVP